ncbi:MAG: 1-acyl-sn-glycerol-3-phosphate acyltransferase [Cyclobacteriaceae bacterium]
MLKWLFKVLFKFNGWHLHTPSPVDARNCIMVAAPHTSNWDFVYAISALDQLGLSPRFTIKKEFSKFPILGGMITALGAIWIDRSPKKEGEKRLSMTQIMVSLFDTSKEDMSVLVTPEGTRSKVTNWKTGFYYTALEAKVPICLAFMDYATHTTGVGMCFMPTGNMEADMKIIMDYYKDVTPKYPSGFSTDIRYAG